MVQSVWVGGSVKLNLSSLVETDSIDNNLCTAPNADKPHMETYLSLYMEIFAEQLVEVFREWVQRSDTQVVAYGKDSIN